MRMDLTRVNDTRIMTSRKLLKLDRTDFPLHLQYCGTTYVLVVTKGGKLLLQKPIE